MSDIVKFTESAGRILPGSRITTEEMLARAYALDSSPYEPKASVVLDVESIEELKLLFAAAAESGVSLTVRGSGTAVSGQGNAEEVLIRLVGNAWKGIEVLEGGTLVRSLCGVKGAEINEALAPYGRYITSDPATIATATIGGMASNNSAGLSCTVPNNIFHRLHGIRLLLADGTLVDTEDEDSVRQFRSTHASLLAGLSDLRAGMLAREDLSAKVSRKYRIRNTCGYSLNAFTEFEDPLDILAHLMIGSEGTLGFILSVTLETAPVTPLRATTMVSFLSMDDAMEAVDPMRAACEMYACEFFDDPTLRSLAVIKGFPSEFVPQGEASDECALLLEVRTGTEEELAERTAKIFEIVTGYQLKFRPEFTTDPGECAKFWGYRQMLFPAITGARKATEYAYTEDYCVPIEHLPEACHAFADILRKLGFKGGVTGHALHGNLHCVIPLETGNPDDVSRLAAFIEESAETVLRLDGSLKGEHGTGRAIAPFVRTEWGDELYGVMLKVKKLLDPSDILNRGVVISDSPKSHVTGLKNVAPAGYGLDLCVDCGFCEAVCPSAKISLSPRQRVYVLRALAGMKARGDVRKAAAWEASFRSKGVDLCATDALCTQCCPLQLDLASAMRGMRHDMLTGAQKAGAAFVRKHLAGTVGTASALLGIASAMERLMAPSYNAGLGRLSGKITGMTLPDLNEVRLCGGSPVPGANPARGREKIVYFPSCAVRSMGYSGESGRKVDPLMDTALRLIGKAGYDAVIPENVQKLCCGKAFETKGMREEADAAAKALGEALLEASENGRWPVMCDTSPCLARMRTTLDPRLRMYEPVEFTLLFLADRLKFTRRHERVAVHPTCSTRKLGLAEKMREVARRCSEEVVMPSGIFCCGFSGDKGLTRPELNKAALAGLAEQIEGCEAGYSTSRTCEIGLTLHGRRFYSNLLYLVDECTEALPSLH